MDFLEQIQALGAKIARQRAQILTEEATKTAFVMPFIQALGYNVFNPSDVTPEYITDVGTKKGEKVDYVIWHEGQPMVIFECKRIGSPLDINQASQLVRIQNPAVWLDQAKREIATAKFYEIPAEAVAGAAMFKDEQS